MVLDAIHAIMIVDTTVDTTEAATIGMMTGTTTDHTGAYHNLSSETLQKKYSVFLFHFKKNARGGGINLSFFQKAISFTLLQRGLQISFQIKVLLSP